jgi:hypothetical protein
MIRLKSSAANRTSATFRPILVHLPARVFLFLVVHRVMLIACDHPVSAGRVRVQHTAGLHSEVGRLLTVFTVKSRVAWITTPVRTKNSSVVIITPRLAASCLLVARNGRPSGRERLAEVTPSHPSPMTPNAPRPFPSQWAGEDERMERSMTPGNRVDSVQTPGRVPGMTHLLQTGRR